MKGNKELQDKWESEAIFKNASEFVRRFREIVIKEGAQKFPIKDPATQQDTTLSRLLGELVYDFELKTDLVDRLRDSEEPDDYMIWITGLKNRHNTVMTLDYAIRQAEAHQFLDWGLKKELDTLRQENLKLNERVEDLSKQLERCLEYKKRVQPLDKGKDERDSMLGDVTPHE